MAADEGDILARRSAIIIGRHHSVPVTTCRVQKITLCDRYSISSSADPWTRGVVGRYHDIIQMMSTSKYVGGDATEFQGDEERRRREASNAFRVREVFFRFASLAEFEAGTQILAGKSGSARPTTITA